MDAKILAAQRNPILERYNIEVKPGHPLHRYRIDNTQYQGLQQALRIAAQNGHLVRMSAPFVLWAAERFRRDYSGGAQTWAFYADPLRANCEDGTFRETTLRGMARMGRPVVQGEAARYYLKTIAAEGGLPRALLADPDGRDRILVLRLMEDILRLGVNAPTEIIHAHANHRLKSFPLGFRQPEFRETLVAFSFELLSLRSQVPPSIPAAARTSWLDSNRPGWLDRLPLRIDEDGARGLVDEALSVEIRPSAAEMFQRVLLRTPNGWAERLAIAAKSEVAQWVLPVADRNLRRLRLLPDLMLAQNAAGIIISAERDDEDQIWRLSRDSGARTAEIDLSLAYPVAFQMIGDGVDLGQLMPAGGAVVDPAEMPTLWTSDSDLNEDPENAAQRLRKLGATAVRTRRPALWLLLGNDDTPDSDGLSIEPDGFCASGRLWRIAGAGSIKCAGWTLRVTTGADEESADRLVAQGGIVSGLRDRNGSDVYSGIPQFMIQPAMGPGRNIRTEELAWRRNPQSGWIPGLPSANETGFHHTGAFQIGWRPNQAEVQAIEQINVLPKATQISLRRPIEGGLTLHARGLAAGTIATLGSAKPSVTNSISGQATASGELALHHPQNDDLAGRVAVDFSTPHEPTRKFRCLLPVPATRAWFVGENDYVLRDDLEIEIGQMRDWRMVLPHGAHADLRLRLISADGENHPNVLRTISHETPLARFAPLIHDMMSIGGADSSIRLRLILSGQESVRLTVRSYLREARWTPDEALMAEGDTQGGEDLELLCLNLLAPHLSTDIVATSGTPLPNLLPADPGPWLILPSDSEGALRPARPVTLKQHNADLKIPRFSDGFAAAGRLTARSQRIAAFAEPLRRLLTPAGQGDLALLLQQMDEMAIVGSLSSLDVVSALAGTPEIPAMMLLQSAPDRLIDRLDLERSSPFAWITLPLNSWLAAAKSERTRLRLRLEAAGLPDEMPSHFASKALVAQIRSIRDHRPDLSGVLLLLANKMNLFSVFSTELGQVPEGLSAPERVLLREARLALGRHGDATHAFELRSVYAPATFDNLNPAIRDLTDAPIIMAEYVLGFRKYPPDRRMAIALLHYQEFDPLYIEAALPAAIAMLSQRP